MSNCTLLFLRIEWIYALRSVSHSLIAPYKIPVSVKSLLTPWAQISIYDNNYLLLHKQTIQTSKDALIYILVELTAIRRSRCFIDITSYISSRNNR